MTEITMGRSRARTFHVSLCVRDAATWPDAKLRGLLADENGDKLKPRVARDALLHELTEGREYLPFVDCDHFDPKTGCLGHVATQENGT